MRNGNANSPATKRVQRVASQTTKRRFKNVSNDGQRAACAPRARPCKCVKRLCANLFFKDEELQAQVCSFSWLRNHNSPRCILLNSKLQKMGCIVDTLFMPRLAWMEKQFGNEGGVLVSVPLPHGKSSLNHKGRIIMCRNCFKRSLGIYTPATDEMLPQDREDLKTFWREYEDWMDDCADLEYERRREERDYE